MTRAVGNGMIQTLANAIGTGAVGKLAKQVAGLSTDMANIKTPDKGSGLMFNPETGKLYIPCGNGVAVNKNTGMLEVPIGYSNPSAIAPGEMIIDGELSFCRAVPGFLFLEFSVRGTETIPKNTPILRVPGYYGDVSSVLFSNKYFAIANSADGMVISSSDDLPVTDYCVLIPAHKLKE